MPEHRTTTTHRPPVRCIRSLFVCLFVHRCRYRCRSGTGTGEACGRRDRHGSSRGLHVRREILPPDLNPWAPPHTVVAALSVESGADPSMSAAGAEAERPLKIVSWNIGLRGLQQLCSSKEGEVGAADVHGIARRTGFGSLSAMLQHFDADIVCLQEHKLAAFGAPERAVALADGYDSFFSICRSSTPSTSFGRYAGVATFCRTACRPWRVEEGLTGVLARPAGTAAAAARSIDDARDRELDGEGRAVVTVHSDLAIVNVYVPAVTSDDEDKAARRHEFKLAFLRALERRCDALLSEGLRVLVIGDMNVSPARIDSARESQQPPPPPSQPLSPSRAWLRSLLRPPAGATQPKFADAFRVLHPLAAHQYTCFHVAAGADAFNFGSRIDLALLAPPPRLIDGATVLGTSDAGNTTSDGARRRSWVPPHEDEQAREDDDDPHAPSARAPQPVALVECSIEAHEDRSDHLPLRVVLRGIVWPDAPPPPPALSSAVRLGGQRLLSSFVGVCAAGDSGGGDGGGASSSSTHGGGRGRGQSSGEVSATSAAPRAPYAAIDAAPPRLTQLPLFAGLRPHSSHTGRGSGRGGAVGFAERSGSSSGTSAGTDSGADPNAGSVHQVDGGGGSSSTSTSRSTVGAAMLAQDGRADGRSQSGGAPSAAEAAASWQALFQRVNERIPACKHGEPCKKQTTRKAGSNQGRQFWSCQRPEGPRTNREANCGFFQWYSEEKPPKRPRV